MGGGCLSSVKAPLNTIRMGGVKSRSDKRQSDERQPEDMPGSKRARTIRILENWSRFCVQEISVGFEEKLMSEQFCSVQR